MRQVCHRLLGAREEAAEVQLDRVREHMRVRGVSIENGKRHALCDVVGGVERSRRRVPPILPMFNFSDKKL